MADCRKCVNFGCTPWCGGIYIHCKLTGEHIKDYASDCSAFEPEAREVRE